MLVISVNLGQIYLVNHWVIKSCSVLNYLRKVGLPLGADVDSWPYLKQQFGTTQVRLNIL